MTDEADRQTYSDNIATLAKQQLTYMAVCEKQMEAQGLTVEDSDIDAQMAEFEEQMGGADQVDEYLKGVGLTREQYSDLARLNVMISKLRAAYLEANPNAARERFYQTYMRCKHVLDLRPSTTITTSWKIRTSSKPRPRKSLPVPGQARL